jgi:hypothetical protein
MVDYQLCEEVITVAGQVADEGAISHLGGQIREGADGRSDTGAVERPHVEGGQRVVEDIREVVLGHLRTSVSVDSDP